MRQQQFAHRCNVLLVLAAVAVFASPFLKAADEPPATPAPVDFNVRHAELEVTRIRSLVAEGALPRNRLEMAEIALEDAKDDAVLNKTLLAADRIQTLTVEEAQEMVDAARRRLDRQQRVVDSRLALAAQGIISQNETQPVAEELELRRHALHLAEERAKLVESMAAMAKAEHALEEGAPAGAVMIHFSGTAPFTPANLALLRSAFSARFGQPLPISALGQTAVHQELGFDHRGRIDVALNPDAREGLWLRQFLESRHIPYIAFRSAVLGSATGPHIHIGPGSSRVPVPPTPETPVVAGGVRAIAAGGD